MPLIDIDALTERDAPASDMWGALLVAAVGAHASDIHLTSEADGLNASFRIDGRKVIRVRQVAGEACYC